MIDLREGSCYPKSLMGVNVALASVDALIALLAFAQVLVYSVKMVGAEFAIPSKILAKFETSEALWLGVSMLCSWCKLSLDDPKDDGGFMSVITVFHLMIGSSNLGYFLYFVLTIVAACKGWICWSRSCGFVVMAFPKILFLAAFLLLLSFCGVRFGAWWIMDRRLYTFSTGQQQQQTQGGVYADLIPPFVGKTVDKPFR
ncbi:putative mitochondrial inner membrane protease subunit 1-like [Capsicum annuum]|nr:putative mitochondrial inner membrane protease subunit 1-like [Capsicum annuum]